MPNQRNLTSLKNFVTVMLQMFLKLAIFSVAERGLFVGDELLDERDLLHHVRVRDQGRLRRRELRSR